MYALSNTTPLKKKRRNNFGASVGKNVSSIQEDTGSIPALAQEVKALAWPWAVVCGSQGWLVPSLAASVV